MYLILDLSFITTAWISNQCGFSGWGLQKTQDLLIQFLVCFVLILEREKESKHEWGGAEGGGKRES